MKKILLVEDDPFLVDIYSKKLQKSGYEVTIETNGSKVLDVAKEIKPDLLLLDIVLPEMDGWEILKKLSESKEHTNLKVIVFSNLGQKDEVQKGMELGAVKYLIKAEYTPSEVIEEVKKTLK